MNTIPTTLSNILKSLAQSLHTSSIFPAIVFVLSNALFVLPCFVPFDLSEPSNIALMLTAILIVSYLLYAFNAPLIRLAEGYSFQQEWLGKVLTTCQVKKYKTYCNELATCEIMIRKIRRRQACLACKHKLIEPEEQASHMGYQCLERWRQGWETRQATALQALHYYYPYPEGGESAIIPTRLGNTIASFETYPYQRYGMDAVAMWPRLVSVLQQNKFLSFVENEKTVFDFLLNMTFLTLVLFVEFSCLVSLRSPRTGLLLMFCLGILALVFYKAAVVGAVNWGTTVKVAFDLYRHHLRRALRLREPTTLKEEQEDWQSLSEFFIEGTPFDGFSYKKEARSLPRYGKVGARKSGR